MKGKKEKEAYGSEALAVSTPRSEELNQDVL